MKTTKIHFSDNQAPRECPIKTSLLEKGPASPRAQLRLLALANYQLFVTILWQEKSHAEPLGCANCWKMSCLWPPKANSLGHQM